MKPTVVFFLNCITQQRCLKRVQEFMDAGYEVAVYGFYRQGKEMPVDTSFEIHSLGVIDNRTPYIRRAFRLTQELRRVIQTYRRRNVIFYLFNMDMALCSLPWLKHKFIYEESDLVHAYCGRKGFEVFMEQLCKRVIRKSLMSVFTSEGFVEYHFGAKRPSHIHVITNRVHTRVATLPVPPKIPLCHEGLSIGFVGIIRYPSVVNLCRAFLEANPHNEFHFFGLVTEPQLFYPLKQYAGCHFHGTYKNPEDLPYIYSRLHLVVSTYDATHVNVRFLEPNKLYEAIYFDTPIIVTKGTFLARKVNRLGIGFEVDALNADDIQRLLRQLTVEQVSEKVQNIRKLDKGTALNRNDDFFHKLELLLHE